MAAWAKTTGEELRLRAQAEVEEQEVGDDDAVIVRCSTVRQYRYRMLVLPARSDL